MRTTFNILLCFFAFANTTQAISYEKVYANLKDAIGEQGRAFPALEVRPGANSVLAYNRTKNTIFIDEKALDICASFGAASEDALAFLLAHELTHFYQEHDWKVAGFGSRFLAAKDTYHRHVVDEQEADLFGAFLTHLAGYRSVKIIPAIFDRVYQTYGLSEHLDKYPSLSERKQVAQEVCKKVSELIQLFETANHLVAINEHLTAAAAYEHILQFVKYKELYKNTGTALVAAAANELQYGETRFYFPLELDADIPLRDGAIADRKELLQKAIQYLSTATRMENQDIGTFINLCSAYILNQQYSEAAQLSTLLTRLESSTIQSDKIAVLKGIIAVKQNDFDRAKQIFQAIQNSSTETSVIQLAKLNLVALEGQVITPNIRPFQPSTEQIEGLDLGYQNDFDFQEMSINNPYTQEENNFGTYQKASATLTHISGYSNTIALLTTDKINTTTSDGLGIGTSFEQIQQAHPDGRMLHHDRGFYLVLPQRKLFFVFDTFNRVSTWGTYEYY